MICQGPNGDSGPQDDGGHCPLSEPERNRTIGMLKGQEVAWMAIRSSVYRSCAGLGPLRPPDGKLVTMGYAANNGHDTTVCTGNDPGSAGSASG